MSNIIKTKRKKRKSPVYVGRETFGNIPKEKAFRKALEPYFEKRVKKIG